VIAVATVGGFGGEGLTFGVGGSAFSWEKRMLSCGGVWSEYAGD
jgi:hypothetical protein